MSKSFNCVSVLVSVMLLFLLSGCGTSSGGEGRSDGSRVSAVPSGDGSALISWMPPTENTDGSALIDLAGYRIYYGTTSGNYSKVVDLTNPGMSSFLVENLGPSEWYFVMTAYNNAGIESAYTPEISTVIVSG